MTNQNVVISNSESGINMSITVAVSNSSIFATTAQKPPPAPGGCGGGGGYISISRTKILKDLDVNGGWIESMRASSPTHVKSLSSLSAAGDHHHNSWTVRTETPSSYHLLSSHLLSLCFFEIEFKFSVSQLHHPSALDMFDQIIEASKGKQIVMFLDYDGTLSPIVEDPDKAFMSEAVSSPNFITHFLNSFDFLFLTVFSFNFR